MSRVFVPCVTLHDQISEVRNTCILALHAFVLRAVCGAFVRMFEWLRHGRLFSATQTGTGPPES